MDDLTPQKVQGDDHDEGQSLGHDRPAQGLVDTAVDDDAQICFRVLFYVFSDTVVDDDRVVQ